MGRFILGRTFQSLVSLFIVTVVIFLLARLTGDPAQLLIPDEWTREQADVLRASLGLDKPLPVQYWIYLTGLFQGDLGTSNLARLPVSDLIVERLPATLELGITSVVLATIIAVPIGIYAAYYRGAPLDLAGRLFAVLGQSMPIFWTGILLIMVFAVILNWLPAGGRGSVLHLVLPSITIGWFVAAGIMRLTRSSMLEVLDSDYVRLARIKGVNERVILWKHAFRNATVPVLTYGAIIMVGVLSGSVVTETVFAWPGLGRLLIEGVFSRDFPVVQGVILLLSSMYILVNLLVDILYVFLNPRLRRGG